MAQVNSLRHLLGKPMLDPERVYTGRNHWVTPEYYAGKDLLDQRSNRLLQDITRLTKQVEERKQQPSLFDE